MNTEQKFFICEYTHHSAKVWDEFVLESRNATFLLQRAYMDYHADRFNDFSLMVYYSDSASRRPVALFPASFGDDGVVTSHGGLTYGGLILPFSGVDGESVVQIMAEICRYYRCLGYKRLRYKAIPHIYHRYPCEEDIYALFRCGARRTECNLSSCIDLTNPIKFNENSRRNMRKAVAAGVTVGSSDNYAAFWQVLEALLDERYSTRPVHTLAEIQMLAGRFPDNIELFTARDASGEVIAGTVLYRTATCVHAQYIAASPAGKQCGALALLFNHVISKHCGSARYFDFGISNEDHGRYLNAGLLRQKNAMGGRGITYNIYEIEL